MSEERGKGEAIVPRKGEELPRRSRHIADAAANSEDDENSRHDRGASFVMRDVVEDLDIGYADWGFKYGCRVAEDKAVCDEHYESESAIHVEGPHDGLGEDDGRVLDFFCYASKVRSVVG